MAAGFAALLVWDQWHWWGTKPDYMFGYLVPLFVAYVVYDRWDRIRNLVSTRPERLPPAWGRRLFEWSAAAALLAGLAVFALGAVMRAGAGPSQPASLALALGFSVVGIAIIYLASGSHLGAGPGTTTGSGSSPRLLLTEPRMRLAALFLFPALVWVISAPLVSAIEGALSRFLLQKVTVVVFFTFDALGLLLERQGNVLILPEGKGTVGVAEACSGIRSLTGSIFSGAFLGAVFLRSMGKKVALLVAALILAFLTNIVRSLFLTAWAYAHGSAAIEGTVHDVTGFAVLGVTFLGLLALVHLFNYRFFTWDEAAPAGRPVMENARELPEASLLRRDG